MPSPFPDDHLVDPERALDARAAIAPPSPHAPPAASPSPKDLGAMKSGFHSRRRPGEPGTKALVEEYGEKLVCVRYYYDADSGRRSKTAEILVNEADWKPGGARQGAPSRPRGAGVADGAETRARATRTGPRRIVGVRVGAAETSLQARVRAAGGKWDRACKLWLLPHENAVRFGLDARIVEDPSGQSRTRAPAFRDERRGAAQGEGNGREGERDKPAGL